MDTTARRRTRVRFRATSEFTTFDEIALYSDVLTGGEFSLDVSPPGSERVLMLRVLSVWTKAVGPHLKNAARPVICHQGRMTVEVRDARWRRELERVRPEILGRLARLLPDHPVRELVFRVKESLPPLLSIPSARPPAVAIASTVPHELAEREGLVSTGKPATMDGDLGIQLQQVMGRYLARSH